MIENVIKKQKNGEISKIEYIERATDSVNRFSKFNSEFKI